MTMRAAGESIVDRHEQALAQMRAGLDPCYFLRHFVYVRSQPDEDAEEAINTPSTIALLVPGRIRSASFGS